MGDHPDDRIVLARRFADFSTSVRSSSPLYAALSTTVERDGDLLDLLLAAPPTQRLPLLLFAAVHDLLLSGIAHPMTRYYGSLSATPRPPEPEAAEAFRDLCLSHRDTLRTTLSTRHTQTNEVRRSVAFLPVLQHLSESRPLALIEIGTSAGLNLLLDRYRVQLGSMPWSGPTFSPVEIRCATHGTSPPIRRDPPDIAWRAGLDSHPLDVRSEDDVRWLRACIWPEHAERCQLLQRAISIARIDPPPLVAGNAIETLEPTVDGVPEELELCIFHSATLPYLTRGEQTRLLEILESVGHRRTIHWIALEGGSTQTFGADLPMFQAHLARPTDRPTDVHGLLGYARWDRGAREDHFLGRVDMHGRWLEWTGTLP